MELIDQVWMLRRQWRWVAGSVLVGALLSTLALLTLPRDHRATADLFVAATVTGSAASNEAASASRYALSRMPSYADLADTDGLATSVIQQLGLRADQQEFFEAVSTYVPAQTTVLEVRAVAGDSASAAALANATASRLRAVIEELETPVNGAEARVSVETLRPAVAADAEVSPGVRTLYVVGVAGGLVAGLLIGTGREQAARRRSPLATRAGAAVEPELARTV